MATDGRLAAYLERIGFVGEPAPDLATLTAVQRGHHLSIPYENLDVQLGRPATTDVAAAFDKLVTRRRGGWCYEMNGVMGWALTAIGFRVTRLAGAVMRSAAGEANVGNHLVLRIDLPEGPMLADAGLGDGPFSPYPLVEGAFEDRGLVFRLARHEDGWWRLHNHALARPPDFDVRPDLSDEARMADRCAWLRTDPESIFVQNVICQRFTPSGHVDLIGRVLRTYGPGGVEERVLPSADAFQDVLRAEFAIEEPEAASLWPKILARHATVFAEGPSPA